MKFSHILASASLASILAVSSASALTYAVTITPEGAGTTSVATNTSSRTDAGNALGAPDATDDSGFFSLGLGKYADFTFGQTFTGTGVVYEVTNGSVAAWPEFVDIFVYNSPLVALTSVATAVRNTTAQAGAIFNFSGEWDTLRIVDVTVRECLAQALNCTRSAAPGADGFDVDAVGVSVVPLPAAMWLLLGVSGALVAAKRRTNRKAV